jgi:hypothetical protein
MPTPPLGALAFPTSVSQVSPFGENGQEAVQPLDVEFPASALKPKSLKEIRLEFAYIPSPYREETVNFAVSIGAGK